MTFSFHVLGALPPKPLQTQRLFPSFPGPECESPMTCIFGCHLVALEEGPASRGATLQSQTPLRLLPPGVWLRGRTALLSFRTLLLGVPSGGADCIPRAQTGPTVLLIVEVDTVQPSQGGAVAPEGSSARLTPEPELTSTHSLRSPAAPVKNAGPVLCPEGSPQGL